MRETLITIKPNSASEKLQATWKT